MQDITNYILFNSQLIFKIILIFAIVLYIVLIIFYFRSSEHGRDTISVLFTLIGNVMLVINIFFIMYDKLMNSINNKINSMKELNNISLSFVNKMFNDFNNHPKELAALHTEIFEKRYSTKPKLTYYETNLLFTVFQVIENMYRTYYISGKDASKLETDQYEGWDNFLFMILASPKVQLFYKKYNHLFKSLDFDIYIKRYYPQIPKNNNIR
jgi:hypothetical protein